MEPAATSAALPLLGIVMVINEKAGHKLVFCYPPEPQALPVRNSGAAGGPGGAPRPDAAKQPSLSTPGYSPFHEPFGYDAQFLADLLTPRSRIVDRRFLLTVDDLTFLGHPASLREWSRDSHGLRSYGDPLDNETSMAVSANLFHIAFVMQASSTYPWKELIDFLYSQVLLPLVQALMHEQHKSKYVTQQLDIMGGIQEEVVNAAHGTQSSASSASAIVARLLEASDLARRIRTIYSMLLGGQSGKLDVNEWIGMSVRPFPFPERIRDQLDPFQPLPLSITTPGKRSGFVPLKLYDTVLLLSTPAELLEALPPDASAPLIRLVEAVNPIKSLQDLHRELDISVSLLCRLAAHLVAWGKARVIHQLTTHNVYVLAPTAILDPEHALWQQFARQFPGVSLLSTLELFGNNRALTEVMPTVPAQRTQFIQMLVWLLQHDFLEERFMYLFVAEQLDKTRSRATSDSELLDKLTQNKPQQPAQLFRRLFPYFGSKYHVDQMLWSEGLTWNDYKSVMDVFANELVVCWA